MPDLSRPNQYSFNNPYGLDSPADFTCFGAASAAGTVISQRPSNLVSVHASNGGTSIRYLQFFTDIGTTTAPSNGGTPLVCYPMAAASTAAPATLLLDSTHFANSKYFRQGMQVAISATNGTLGTAGVVTADHNLHIKYVES